MIRTKEELKKCLEMEMARFSKPFYAKIFGFLRGSEESYIERYQRNLRYLEFYKNNKDNVIYRLCYYFCSIKWTLLGHKTGILFFPNTIDVGLKLYHTDGGKTGGTSKVKIGKYVTIRYNVNFGYNGDSTRVSDECPIIEDYVEFSPGAKVFGKIKVGRGALIGMNAVPMSNVPPYAIVIGNPGKVIGFTKTPQEVVEFEKDKYNEQDRLPIELLEKNYSKYFIERIVEIKQFMKIQV